MDTSNALLSALSGITGTGSFHSTGTAPFFLPSLEVDGVGEIAFPLPAAQARELIAMAEAAPYGMGMKTMHDESVRKCWQLDASRFSINSVSWQKFLRKTIGRVREELGITGKVSAHPYKLLVYGKGGHFKAHCDTEKLDAMFGTLIIALPSAHEGGRLFIRHAGSEIEVDFSQKQYLHDFQHAAFFADCEHEVEPVRSGYRCCLVYNLRLDEGDPAALNLALDAQARSLLSPLAALKSELRGKLAAVLLEHSYTEANFSLRTLKGHDQARARALFSAAREAGLTAHLGLVTYHQSGLLEEGGYRRSRRRHWDDEDDAPVDGTMGEIHDESWTIDCWRDENDSSVALGTYHIDKDLLFTEEDFGTGEPDEKEAEGYTGNAGCTMDYWYRRAAIVLWAVEDDEEILCHYDFDGACRTLTGLVPGGKQRPGARFYKLLKAIISRLPEMLTPAVCSHGMPDENRLSITLEALAKAGMRKPLEELLPAIPDHAWTLCNLGLWKKLHKAFGVKAFSTIYDRLTQGDPDPFRDHLFPILDALLIHKDGATFALNIACRLARLKPRPPKSSGWGREKESNVPGDRTEVRILLAASRLMENAADRNAVMDFVLADRSLGVVRHVLAPVMLDTPALITKGTLGEEVLVFSKALLKEEVCRPLKPLSDWVRPCPEPVPVTTLRMRFEPPHDAALRELAAFMADPAAKNHVFRYAESIRSALTSFIVSHTLDLDHVTLRKGSPHQLSCTKNDNSHRRALALRAEDEKRLAQLNAI